jgi:hypothetical protein
MKSDIQCEKILMENSDINNEESSQRNELSENANKLKDIELPEDNQMELEEFDKIIEIVKNEMNNLNNINNQLNDFKNKFLSKVIF